LRNSSLAEAANKRNGTSGSWIGERSTKANQPDFRFTNRERTHGGCNKGDFDLPFLQPSCFQELVGGYHYRVPVHPSSEWDIQRCEESEPGFVNFLQFCWHHVLPPPPRRGSICFCRALFRIITSQPLDERAIEVKHRDFAPARRVEVGCVKAGALGCLDPLERSRCATFRCAARVPVEFGEERTV
jgi:hypothetical protein